jgi:SNF2 family DNA or RNA helicase
MLTLNVVVKSDSSLIFNRLRTLNTAHRILMTGTPLNNNIRELFNLLNFLDPGEFK